MRTKTYRELIRSLQEFSTMIDKVNGISNGIDIITDNLDNFLTRIENIETKLEANTAKTCHLEERVDVIADRLQKLEAAGGVIWQDRAGTQIAFSRPLAYSEFADLGITPRMALKALDSAGYLVKGSNGGKNSRIKSVRPIGTHKTTKAVVVYRAKLGSKERRNDA